MGYALRRRPITKPGLLALFSGARLELVEIPFGPLTDLAIEAGGDLSRRNQAALGAALCVDGVPLGLEALRAIPGRFSVELAELMKDVQRMHSSAGPEDEDDDEDEGGTPSPDEPGEAAPAPPPGEALRA